MQREECQVPRLEWTGMGLFGSQEHCLQLGSRSRLHRSKKMAYYGGCGSEGDLLVSVWYPCH